MVYATVGIVLLIANKIKLKFSYKYHLKNMSNLHQRTLEMHVSLDWDAFGLYMRWKLIERTVLYQVDKVRSPETINWWKVVTVLELNRLNFGESSAIATHDFLPVVHDCLARHSQLLLVLCNPSAKPQRLTPRLFEWETNKGS